MKWLLAMVLFAGCGKAVTGIDNDDGKPRSHIRGEAYDNLDKIARAAKKAFADTKSFPVGTAKLLPVGNPESGSYAGQCCGVKDASGAVVNKCQADAAAFKADPIWSKLEFSVDAPGLYQYSYVGSEKSFTAIARGDADCDTQFANFTIVGEINASGDPVVNITMPGKGQY
ncbi:MAG: hypothetical protein QM831_21045 [Kofleriaceae bacterium]